MHHRHLLAAATLLAAAATAHAEHFQYLVDLTGTYANGGPAGCTPPDFNQPACPQPGSLTATLSFDTPGSGDGSYLVTGDFGDITNFYVSLDSMPEDTLFGDVNVVNGAPNGSVQASDESETFTFDWADRSASYSYDYGDYGPSGDFTGTLSPVPEPASLGLMLAGLAGFAGLRSRRGMGNTRV